MIDKGQKNMPSGGEIACSHKDGLLFAETERGAL